MRLSKAQREQLRMMFGGLCAYCGGELPERWHADHVEGIQRMDWVKRWGLAGSDGLPLKPNNDRIDNLFPACPQCNLSKGSMSLEEWRGWLAGHVNSLNAYHSIYRLCRAFGLVEETGNRVVFYFERYPQDGRMSHD